MPLVVIDPATHYRIAKYALANNISVDLAIVEVVSDWLDSREDTFIDHSVLVSRRVRLTAN